MVVWDFALVPCLFALSAWIGGLAGADAGSLAGFLAVPALVMGGVSVVALGFGGAYGWRRAVPGQSAARVGRLVLVSGFSGFATLVVCEILGRATSLAQTAAVAAVLPLGWLLGRVVVEAGRARNPERVLVIGTGEVAQRVVSVSRRSPEVGMRVVGFLDDQPLALDAAAPPVLGGLDDLAPILDRGDVDRVVVAFSPRSDGEILTMLRSCDQHGVDVDVVPRMFDLMGDQAEARSVGGLPLVGIRGQRMSLWSRCIKRTMDIVLSGVALVVASPVIAASALAIVIDDPGPVFFRQLRVGRDGRKFRVLKLRTMRVEGDTRDALPPAAEGGIEEIVRSLKGDDHRVTRVGRVLRRTSLDELPQLWNVLVGQMSLVGPRPLRPFEVAELSDWQRGRQQVRPGITGLWQVLGRSDIDWRERMQLDYTYVRHWSVASDLRILWRTVPVVLRRKGAV
jgi:exopolysaccharide biosynthesis polyprenyl glycosylphosphotransferase